MEIPTQHPALGGLLTRRIRREALAALTKLQDPILTESLLRHIAATRHASRLGAALRAMEDEGIVTFTTHGWLLVHSNSEPRRRRTRSVNMSYAGV